MSLQQKYLNFHSSGDQKILTERSQLSQPVTGNPVLSLQKKHERLIEDLQVTLSERDAEIIRLNMYLNDSRMNSSTTEHQHSRQNSNMTTKAQSARRSKPLSTSGITIGDDFHQTPTRREYD